MMFVGHIFPRRSFVWSDKYMRLKLKNVSDCLCIFRNIFILRSFKNLLLQAVGESNCLSTAMTSIPNGHDVATWYYSEVMSMEKV